MTRTQCQCGGTFDGTPSGRKRHDRTGRHQEWSAGQMAEVIAARAAEADTVAAALQPVDPKPEFPVTGDKVRVALYVVTEVDVDALARHMGYAFTKREAITAVRQSLYVAATQAAYPEGIVTPVSDNRSDKS